MSAKANTMCRHGFYNRSRSRRPIGCIACLRADVEKLADAVNQLAMQVEQLTFLTHLNGASHRAASIRLELVKVRESIAELIPE